MLLALPRMISLDPSAAKGLYTGAAFVVLLAIVLGWLGRPVSSRD